MTLWWCNEELLHANMAGTLSEIVTEILGPVLTYSVTSQCEGKETHEEYL